LVGRWAKRSRTGKSQTIKPSNSQTEWRNIDLSQGRFHLRQLAMKNRLMTPFTHSGALATLPFAVVSSVCLLQSGCGCGRGCGCRCRCCSCRQQLQHFPAAIEMAATCRCPLSLVPRPLCEAVIYPTSFVKLYGN